MLIGKFRVIAMSIGLLLASVSAHADYLAMNGAELYGRFCASCHGANGHGDGPVSKVFKTEVPDLTLIARRHGGNFPTDRIQRIIDGRSTIPSHGARDMPVWGQELARTELGSPDAERAGQLMIERLLEYVRSLQRPATNDTGQK